MIKNTREENVVVHEGRENLRILYFFFHMQEKETEAEEETEIGQIFWSSFFCQDNKKEKEFFSKQLHSFIHLLLIITSVLLFCGVTFTFRRPQREALRSLLSKNTEREREREFKCLFFFLG
tara:strand:- start:88 stop:450 length:363 start_codon:yes stop_codon:yes gene_type:complete